MSNIKSRYVMKRNVGKSPSDSLHEILTENIETRFKGLKLLTKSDMRKLKEKVSPAKRRLRLEQALSRETVKKKQQDIKAIFGLNGEKLGIVLIQPEAMHLTPQVRKFLSGIDSQVVFSKPLVFSRGLAYRIFGERQFKKYPDFALSVARFISGPSRVLVFTHPPDGYVPRAPYMHELRRTNPAKYARKKKSAAQLSNHGAFNRLVKGSHAQPEKGTLRGDIIWPVLGDKEIAERFDHFKYIKTNPQANPFSQLAGVHAPVEAEFLKEVANFFTLREIRLIGRLSRRNKKS